MKKENELNIREYVSILKGLVEEGKEVGMPVIGTSMEPFLRDRRDEIYFHRPHEKLLPGDMVFYQRLNGQYVMHRIYKKSKEKFYMTGDHQSMLEGPVREEQIFAVVTSVKRKGKILTKKDLTWKFYAGCWRYLFPFRGVLLGVRGNVSKLKARFL